MNTKKSPGDPVFRAAKAYARSAMRVWAMEWRMNPNPAFLRWAKFHRESFFRFVQLEKQGGAQ